MNPKWGLRVHSGIRIGSSLGSPDGPGWVCLGAGLSSCIPHLMLLQDIWGSSCFNFNPRRGLWALARGRAVAVALALTWWPGEQEVSS